MKFLVSGASGLIGSKLVSCLKDRGHTVCRLVRKEKDLGENTVLWDPEHVELKQEDYEGFDVVVHLAGENIATGRWTREKKKRIKDSRVIGTHMLSELFARLESPPKVFLCASAIGFYGDRGEELMTEKSEGGEGFLSEVCQKWEQATEPARAKGTRVVNLRIGVVLSREGGALKNMLLPFRLGLGGVIGSGDQYISWIDIDDLVGAILHVVSHEKISGAVNLVSPEPVTNREFTKTLGRVLKRPTIFPLPATLARWMMGELADALLLSSTKVAPEILEQTGYAFLYPKLDQSLNHLLGKK